jgi:hypothetical protein
MQRERRLSGGALVLSPSEENLRKMAEVPERDLGDTKSWLHDLAYQEHDNIDWTPEYPYWPHGHFTESNNGGHYIPFELGLNTDVLKRIEQGLGPRSTEPEDLVAPLRGYTAADSDEAQSGRDICNELLKVLQAWNEEIAEERYGRIEDENRDEAILEDMHRDELVDALDERGHILPYVRNNRRAQEDLEVNTERLQRAFWACRPEIAEFRDQTPYNIIAVWIANHLIATPNIETDPELWDILFKTMLAEAELQLDGRGFVNNKKAEIQDRLRSAIQDEEIKILSKQKNDLDVERLTRGAVMVISDLKRARENLHRTKLEEMEELAVIQSSQKSLLEKRLPDARNMLEQSCDPADAALETILGQRMEKLQAEQEMTQSVVQALGSLGKNSWIRVRKFSAHDIKDPVEKAAVLAERSDNPQTAEMMFKVTDENGQVSRTSRQVCQTLSRMQTSLEEVYAASKRRYQAYDVVLNRVGAVDEEGAEEEPEVAHR